MSAWLQKHWYRLSLWHLLLVPLSWLFWLLSSLRRLGYKSGLLSTYKLPVPVIVIGNISVGGTGKTPLVIWMAQKLKVAGYRPGIVSRGYAGSIDAVSPVTVDSDPGNLGDEPVLLAKRSACPVWVGRDRVAAAKALLKANPECNVIVSDDGLQHYRLQRDIEVAVVDGQRGFGNGRLIPAGPLREGPARLRQVDAVVYNGGHPASGAFAMHLESAAFHNLLEPAKTATAKDFSGQVIYAIAAIGNPARFFQRLAGLGLRFQQHAFPDHHAYQPADLQNIAAGTILMTEKDAVKCMAFAKENWWYLPVSAVVEPGLAELIMNKLRN
ncbi:MAG TPA: tetraacyldisaccharide 4'-kinase [Methylophilaceae bacterium]|jgi:tetraacyldisaccharide 4'-kinase